MYPSDEPNQCSLIHLFGQHPAKVVPAYLAYTPDYLFVRICIGDSITVCTIYNVLQIPFLQQIEKKQGRIPKHFFDKSSLYKAFRKNQAFR